MTLRGNTHLNYYSQKCFHWFRAARRNVVPIVGGADGVGYASN